MGHRLSFNELNQSDEMSRSGKVGSENEACLISNKVPFPQSPAVQYFPIDSVNLTTTKPLFKTVPNAPLQMWLNLDEPDYPHCKQQSNQSGNQNVAGNFFFISAKFFSNTFK